MSPQESPSTVRQFRFSRLTPIGRVRIRISVLRLGKNLASAPITWVLSQFAFNKIGGSGLIWLQTLFQTPHLWIKKKVICYVFVPRRADSLSVATAPQSIWEKKAWWSMKHHRVFAIIWDLCACSWNWFPLFVRLAKSGMPSSGKIVRMLVHVPSDCQKILGNDSTDPLTPADCV